MRKSTMLVILAMVVILATPVLSKEVSRTSWRVDEAPSVVKDLTEGFEGVFPPTGWTIASPSGHTGLDSWFQGATSAYEGLYSAEVDYDEELVAQDCRMSFDYTIADGEDHLNFAVSASAYWMINYTLKVLVDDVEVFDLAAVYGDVSWVYEIHDVDLTAYNGQTITITFQYVGLDGAALTLVAALTVAGAAFSPFLGFRAPASCLDLPDFSGNRAVSWRVIVSQLAGVV